MSPSTHPPASPPHTATTRSGEVIELIPVGSRIRSRQHPELTGVIKAHEWNSPDFISPIPYLIGWDDSEHAHAVLGMLFVYASNHGIEATR